MMLVITVSSTAGKHVVQPGVRDLRLAAGTQEISKHEQDSASSDKMTSGLFVEALACRQRLSWVYLHCRNQYCPVQH